jgi:hypothetical protein
MDNTNIKKNNKSNIGCFIKTLFLVAIPYLFFYVNNTIKIKDNENEQIGLYQIDLKKTNLSVYTKDSAIYKNLQITFKGDGYFYINMSAPFLYDIEGK